MRKFKRYKITGYKGAWPFLDEWNPPTKEEIAKHEAHVEDLKRKGEYLQPYTSTVDFIHNPKYDDRSYTPSTTLQSARFSFLDFSANGSN